MNLSSDEEIAQDEENVLNKVPCQTEKTIEKLNSSGLDLREMMAFEDSLKGN